MLKFETHSSARSNGGHAGGVTARVSADKHKSVRSITKRGFDILSMTGLLIFLSPLLLVIAVLIKMQDGGSILHKQKRVGRDGKEFTFLKFRSMVEDAEAKLKELIKTDPDVAAEWGQYQKLKVDPRITPVGRFLRRSSLDELPQLFNILRGDMSLVGPRPIMISQIDDYGVGLYYYHQVRPGLTGLWQVSGRNEVSFQQRVKFDQEYVQNWSLMSDVSICLRTVPAVLCSSGAF